MVVKLELTYYPIPRSLVAQSFGAVYFHCRLSLERAEGRKSQCARGNRIYHDNLLYPGRKKRTMREPRDMRGLR